MLNKAVSICLISDIRTSKQMLDFMGVAAAIVNEFGDREIIVIGMQLMQGIHNAENIKVAIESIVNEYDFDKGIIHGHSSDEGSAYVRLMKQHMLADEPDSDSDDSLILYSLNVDNDNNRLIDENNDPEEEVKLEQKNEEKLLTTYKLNEEYDKHMKPVFEYAHDLTFDDKLKCDKFNSDTHYETEFDFENQEDSLYDFSRPVISNDEQLIRTIGTPVAVPRSKPIKKLEIQIGILDMVLNHIV